MSSLSSRNTASELLKYIIAVYCQIYKHTSVQSVSECLENFISKEGKEFLSIYVRKQTPCFRDTAQLLGDPRLPNLTLLGFYMWGT